MAATPADVIINRIGTTPAPARAQKNPGLRWSQKLWTSAQGDQSIIVVRRDARAPQKLKVKDRQANLFKYWANRDARYADVMIVPTFRIAGTKEDIINALVQANVATAEEASIIVNDSTKIVNNKNYLSSAFYLDLPDKKARSTNKYDENSLNLLGEEIILIGARYGGPGSRKPINRVTDASTESRKGLPRNGILKLREIIQRNAEDPANAAFYYIPGELKLTTQNGVADIVGLKKVGKGKRPPINAGLLFGNLPVYVHNLRELELLVNAVYYDDLGKRQTIIDEATRVSLPREGSVAPANPVTPGRKSSGTGLVSPVTSTSNVGAPRPANVGPAQGATTPGATSFVPPAQVQPTAATSFVPPAQAYVPPAQVQPTASTAYVPPAQPAPSTSTTGFSGPATPGRTVAGPVSPSVRPTAASSGVNISTLAQPVSLRPANAPVNAPTTPSSASSAAPGAVNPGAIRANRAPTNPAQQ